VIDVGLESVITKLMFVLLALPSTTEGSLIVIDGLASSFVIVPKPWASLTEALPGLNKLTKKSSFGSVVISPVTSKLTVFVVWPGANVRLPLVAW
jgi:hypothetical protein